MLFSLFKLVRSFFCPASNEILRSHNVEQTTTTSPGLHERLRLVFVVNFVFAVLLNKGFAAQ